MNQIPDARDWIVDVEDPDSVAVCDAFLGKSNQEIEGLLAKNFIMRCLDLNSMSDVPFRYYSEAFVAYLMVAEYADEDFGVFANCFISAVWHRSEQVRSEFWKGHTELLAFLRRRAESYVDDEETRVELLCEISGIEDEILLG